MPERATRPAGGPDLASGLDDAVLRHLVAELGGGAAVTRLCETFLDLLPVRLHRLESALRGQDRDAALDVSLSLKVSAATVGGRSLSQIAARIESLVRQGRLDACGPLLVEAEARAETLARALRTQLPL